MAVRTHRYAFGDQRLSRRPPRLGSVLRLLLAISIMPWLAACGTVAPVHPVHQVHRPAAPTAPPPTRGALYSDGQTDRWLLGGGWLYRADRADVGLPEGWWRDTATTAGWSAVSVPNAYNARDFSTASMAGYVGWYRRDFTLPAAAFASYVPAADRKWIIRFESVNYSATVWLNGHELGTHAGAYLPFEFLLTGLRPGVNQLVVRVDDRRTPADLPPGPSGGWWNYGGILQEVYLRAVQGADLEQVQVRSLLPCPTCAATIQEQALVHNVTSAPQTVGLRGFYGRAGLDFGEATIPAGGTWTATSSVRITHPDLWAPGHPALYLATLTLSDPLGRPLGGYQLYSGIRGITVTRDGRLELNGRLLDLRGVNRHEQSLATGAALDPAQLAGLMARVQQLGATVIRAHYPLNPQLEEMADRDGVLIWSEIPVWGVSSEELNQPAWVARAHAMLAQNILENQNHPSILLWSVGNELPTPATPAEASYIAGAVALAHRLDPTRPVALAATEWPLVGCQKAYAPLDVIGLNDYFGWFHTSTTPMTELGPFLDSLHSCYPHKAMIVSEFGFDANHSGPASERGTYAYQSRATAYHLRVFAARPWLSGAIYFTLQDFASRPGWDGGNPQGEPPFVQNGLIDLNGNLKPAFATVASMYHATVQIAPSP
jgi:Glycosyl hydrolases family 2, TIM barrel domain/Glycosyl hydrolases family 2, sugar binding domain